MAYKLICHQRHLAIFHGSMSLHQLASSRSALHLSLPIVNAFTDLECVPSHASISQRGEGRKEHESLLSAGNVQSLPIFWCKLPKESDPFPLICCFFIVCTRPYYRQLPILQFPWCHVTTFCLINTHSTQRPLYPEPTMNLGGSQGVAATMSDLGTSSLYVPSDRTQHLTMHNVTLLANFFMCSNLLF